MKTETANKREEENPRIDAKKIEKGSTDGANKNGTAKDAKGKRINAKGAKKNKAGVLGCGAF